MGFFEKLTSGLKKTRDNLTKQVEQVFSSFNKVDEDMLEELSDVLIMSDVGAAAAQRICDTLKSRAKQQGINDSDGLRALLITIIEEILSGGNELKLPTAPTIVVLLGVNGTGKTTTAGRLAYTLKGEGHKVLIGAADTFRAAAIEQLAVWAERAGVDIIKHEHGSDPAAVVFDTITAGKARGADVLLIDTSGRLHNKKNLMDELSKISRVCEREGAGLHTEVLLVLDATTGQNGVNQAREFSKAAGITGIVLTKLDGTAKGGVVLSIREELGLPVMFVGVGEGIEDLQVFDPAEFARALFS